MGVVLESFDGWILEKGSSGKQRTRLGVARTVFFRGWTSLPNLPVLQIKAAIMQHQAMHIKVHMYTWLRKTECGVWLNGMHRISWLPIGFQWFLLFIAQANSSFIHPFFYLLINKLIDGLIDRRSNHLVLNWSICSLMHFLMCGHGDCGGDGRWRAGGRARITNEGLLAQYISGEIGVGYRYL